MHECEQYDLNSGIAKARSFSVQVDKTLQHLLTLSRNLPVLSQGVVIGCLYVADKLAPFHVVFLGRRHLMVYLTLVLPHEQVHLIAGLQLSWNGGFKGGQFFLTLFYALPYLPHFALPHLIQSFLVQVDTSSYSLGKFFCRCLTSFYVPWRTPLSR